MDPIVLLALATGAFLVTHFVPSTPLRAAIVRSTSEKAYLGLYTLVAFATLGAMIYAYNRAPVEPLWPGLRLLPALLMPFSFILVICGVAGRNPTAVGQDKVLKADEPARGILRVTRHPVQFGILLWAIAHVLARGELKSTIFFGGFAILSALGMVLIDSRKARTLGEDWKRFAGATSGIPFVAIAQGRNRFDAAEIGIAKPLAGLALYAILLFTHSWLFGARAY